jgi:hypothetical protein
MINATTRLLYPRESDLVPTVREVEWAPGPIWTGPKTFTLTGIQSSDRPALSGAIIDYLVVGHDLFLSQNFPLRC